MTCFYQETLPEESLCRERRQQRRLLPHRNLWAGCGKCGVILTAKGIPVTEQNNDVSVTTSAKRMKSTTGRATGKAAPRYMAYFAGFNHLSVTP